MILFGSGTGCSAISWRVMLECSFWEDNTVAMTVDIKMKFEQDKFLLASQVFVGVGLRCVSILMDNLGLT